MQRPKKKIRKKSDQGNDAIKRRVIQKILRVIDLR